MREIVKNDIDRIADYEMNWSALDGKTLLVTGANGFIGSLLIEAVLVHNRRYGTNINVVAAVRSVSRGKEKFEEFLPDEHIEFLEWDVTEPNSDNIKVDYLLHCASNAAPDKYAGDPVGTMQINFYGTYNTLEFAKRNNVSRYIYASTIEIYGRTANLETIHEDEYGYISATNVRSCYPMSKKCCENLTVCYGDQYGLDVSIGRIAYIYGAGSSDTDAKVGSAFARQVAKGEDIIMGSPGTQRRSYTYVTDAVTGLLTVAVEGKNGEAYNIASPYSRITIAEMAQLMCDLFPEQNSKVVFQNPNDSQKRAFSFIEDAVLDSDKLEALGWKPVVSPEDGFRYTIQDYMDRQ